MRRRFFTKRWLAALVIAAMSMPLTSCGTIIHPERRGQPPGRLDPAIVVLDAVGLLLFFVPGVIAFAVDFSTGTIYLPPEGVEGSPVADAADLRPVRLSSAQLTRQNIESVVQEKTGRTVRLQPGEYRAARLARLEDLASPDLEERHVRGPVSSVIFRESR